MILSDSLVLEAEVAGRPHRINLLWKYMIFLLSDERCGIRVF